MSSGGVDIKPDFTIKDLLSGENTLDIVVLPGGVGVCPNVCHKIQGDKAVTDQFRTILNNASHVLTICTGSFIIPSVFQPGKSNSDIPTNVKQSTDASNTNTNIYTNC